MKRIFLYLLILCACAIVACEDNDSFTTSPTARLSFSTDSVKMDTVFSTIGSRTYDFWVYNRSRDGLRLTTVRLAKGNQSGFRVNVDGSYLDRELGAVVHGLEVRRDDSIRVFVELTASENGFPDPQKVEDELVFILESGVEQRVPLLGHAWDAVLMDSLMITRDSLLQSRKPFVIHGGLRVDSAVTLTVRNTTLYFHDGAGIDVYGTLKTDSVVMRGDRLDHMFDYLPYDRISGQWRGVRFYSSSFGNRLVYTEIRNAIDGIVCDSAAFTPGIQRLYMEHSIVHNCAGPGLKAFNSILGLKHCQFTNTLGDCVAVYGGVAVMDHCTLAQFYPFSADRGAALRFANYYGSYDYPLESVQMTGSIVTGYADDVLMRESRQAEKGDSTKQLPAFNFLFENSLLRTPQVFLDDAKKQVPDTIRFVNVRWETPDDSIQGKQHFRLIDEQNLRYDFHLDSLSTAHGLGCW